MTRLRFGHAATRLADGRVLVTGGGFVEEDDAEIYNPATGAWTLTASMATEQTAHTGHTATLLPGGTVLVAGGAQSVGDQPSAEIFTP
jgi:hypothetical protein